MVGHLSMLDVFYIGQDRFTQQTQDNHAEVLRQIQQRFGVVTVHRFLQPDFDRSDSPIDVHGGNSGGIQVWDFMKACQILTAPVVMKWRTDNWFATSSIEPMLRSIERVMSTQVDVAFLGINAKSGLDVWDQTHPSTHHKKVPDFVIIAQRQTLQDINLVRTILSQAREVKNGNRVFKIIARDFTRCETTWCRIFLLREHRDIVTDYVVARDFVSGYKGNESAMTYLNGCDPQQPL
jgi:hypothetical protein